MKKINLKNFRKKWIMFGVVILVWTIFWFVEVRILNHYEFIINVMMLVVGYCLLINYALASVAYFIIKRLKRNLVIKD